MLLDTFSTNPLDTIVQEAVEDASTSTSAKKQEGAEVVRCQSPEKSSGGGYEQTSITTTVGGDTTTTTTVETAGIVCDPEIRSENTGVVGEQDDEENGQGGETKGRHEGKAPSNSTSTSSPKVWIRWRVNHNG